MLTSYVAYFIGVILLDLEVNVALCSSCLVYKKFQEDYLSEQMLILSQRQDKHMRTIDQTLPPALLSCFARLVLSYSSLGKVTVECT